MAPEFVHLTIVVEELTDEDQAEFEAWLDEMKMQQAPGLDELTDVDGDVPHDLFERR